MVIVFGSVNVDITTMVDHLPKNGETIHGSDSAISPGGKGANQALAARRMGTPVFFIGAVGNDAFAQRATELLDAAEVNLSYVRVADRPTSVAFISVERSGENCIVLSPGANATAQASVLESVPTTPADILLLQYEIPSAETHAAIAWAHRRGITTILNLAPAFAIPAESLRDVDILVTNELECRFLADALGIPSEPEVFAETVARTFDLTVIVRSPLRAWSHMIVSAPIPWKLFRWQRSTPRARATLSWDPWPRHSVRAPRLPTP